MIFDDDQIAVSSHNISKSTVEISLAHRDARDLFGEIKTVVVLNKGASIRATIYEKSKKIFSDAIDVPTESYRVSGVPYKIAVSNVRNELLAKMKEIMHEAALSREVVPEERDAFINMFQNTCKAFPHLSKQQGMNLALDALKAKRKRELLAEDEAPVFATE
jgi:hypothetical protein